MLTIQGSHSTTYLPSQALGFREPVGCWNYWSRLHVSSLSSLCNVGTIYMRLGITYVIYCFGLMYLKAHTERGRVEYANMYSYSPITRTPPLWNCYKDQYSSNWDATSFPTKHTQVIHLQVTRPSNNSPSTKPHEIRVSCKSALLPKAWLSESLIATVWNILTLGFAA